MNLVVFCDDVNNGGGRMVQLALANPVIAGMLSGCYAREVSGWPSVSGRPGLLAGAEGETILWAIPKGWEVGATGPALIRFDADVPWDAQWTGHAGPKEWFVISNGRFATQVSQSVLNRVLAGTSAAVVAVQVRADLVGYHERTLLTEDGKIVGFRRFYEDSAEPATMPRTWPHHLFVRAAELKRAFEGRGLPQDFSQLADRWQGGGMACTAFEVAGAAHDLSTEAGLLSFFVGQAAGYDRVPPGWTLKREGSSPGSGKGRCVGKVWQGLDVQIGSDVVLVGPSLMADGVKVDSGAVVASSIVGPGVTIGSGRYVGDSVVTREGQVHVSHEVKNWIQGEVSSGFRTWPWFSYARCPKRVIDIVVAGLVLTLFAPLLPLIALAIKVDSHGPVFFKHRRQGRHGKEFNCLKFRTMKVGADQIQETLRAVSEVDGPQFKIVDDPRITSVGHFLRETYLDEIPQFFNVLAGQMSAIGPRPSPRAENTLCPYWRYARLSVRPGVTGLWQINRTRLPMKDFQEWILYDTEYVKNLSLGTDIRLCWETFLKMLGKFAQQF